MTEYHKFLEMMARERRATRATLSAYETDLRVFYEFLKNPKAAEVTPKNIQDYLSSQSHLSAPTLARRISSLRQFYTYLVKSGVTKENPFTFVKIALPKAKSFSSLCPTHVKDLWEGAKAWTSPEGKRLFLLFQILQATHWPVKKIVSLPFTDGLSGDLFTLAVPHTASSRAPAGGVAIQKIKEKLDCDVACAPRNDDNRCALQEYLEIRPYFFPQGQNSSWLFPSSGQSGHLTSQRFGQLLKELGLKLGIDPALMSLSTFRNGLLHFKKI